MTDHAKLLQDLIAMRRIHYVFGKPNDGQDVLWRLEAKRYSYVVDPDREEYGITDPRLEMMFFFVESRTEKGAWLQGRQFVLLTATKRFACNTQEEALESFIARKKKHVEFARGKLRLAEMELSLAEPVRHGWST